MTSGADAPARRRWSSKLRPQRHHEPGRTRTSHRGGRAGTRRHRLRRHRCDDRHPHADNFGAPVDEASAATRSVTSRCSAARPGTILYQTIGGGA